MRRSFVVWSVVALVWANLPYLVGYVQSSPSSHFGGFFLYEQDGYSYLTKMRQGALGAWTFHLPYTSEDEYQAGGVAYLFYLATGRLAALGLDYGVIYHAARLASSLLLLIVLARFIRRCAPHPRWQVWAWWLVLFGGGWGMLISTFIPQYVAYEIIAPDAFVFSILYGPPHVIFGFALLLFWIDFTRDTLRPGAAHVPGRILLANLIGLLAALSREAYGPAYAGIFAAYLIALWIYTRRVPWRAAAIVALSATGAGLYSLYLLIAFRTIPGFIVWSSQNPFGTPGPFDLLLGFAPLIGLAVWGLLSRRWRRRLWVHRPPTPAAARRGQGHEDTKENLETPRAFVPPWLFVVAWAIAGPILAYLPLSINRRLIAGWQIPLCILGAYALLCFVRSRARCRRAIAALLLATALPTTVVVIAGGSALVALRQPPLFQPADQLAALEWLGRHATGHDVVLSDWRFGNQVPIHSEARVFAGHPIETARFKEKTSLVARVLDPSTLEPDRQAILNEWRITLIVVGPESAVRLDPGRYTLKFAQGAYAIYGVG